MNKERAHVDSVVVTPATACTPCMADSTSSYTSSGPSSDMSTGGGGGLKRGREGEGTPGGPALGGRLCGLVDLAGTRGT